MTPTRHPVNPDCGQILNAHARGLQNVQREIKLVDERLAALPSLEETLKRFQEAGLEERLKEKSQLVREERVLTTAGERLDPVRSVHQELVGVVPIDTAFSSAKAVEGLPNAELLTQAEGILNRLTERLRLAARANFWRNYLHGTGTLGAPSNLEPAQSLSGGSLRKLAA